MELILIAIGLVFGIFITYLICRPKMIICEKENSSIAQTNQELIEQNRKLLTDNSTIVQKRQEIEALIAENQEKKAKLEGQVNILERSLQEMGSNAEKAAAAIQESAMLVMQTRLSEQAELLGYKFQEAEENYREEYLQIQKELADELNNTLEEIASAKVHLVELSKTVQAAVAANIREEEKRNNTSFYTIDISEIDIQEVKKIKEIIPFLRNGRPIAKAIWECYYRNPTNDLINRVVGAGTHTGIYCITCLLDNKKYIGQARDLKDRWITHIKCGLGIDTTNNKLYQAMLKFGVENFSFEIIEECAASDLNRQEKYWIEHFQSNIYGYNMTGGGSRS